MRGNWKFLPRFYVVKSLFIYLVLGGGFVQLVHVEYEQNGI